MESSEEIVDERPRRTLRSTLIEPFKQIKLGLYVMLICLAFLICAGYLFFAAFTEQYAHVMEIFNVVDPSTQWELVTNDVFVSNAVKLGILFTSFLAVLFTVVFKMTHKIYGPLVSIERYLDELAETGDYRKRVVIRRNDELQRLAQKLNDLAEKFETKYGSPDRRRRDVDGVG